MLWGEVVWCDVVRQCGLVGRETCLRVVLHGVIQCLVKSNISNDIYLRKSVIEIISKPKVSIQISKAHGVLPPISIKMHGRFNTSQK